MSEQEFENWLSLLTGLLQLSPGQRDNISDELRSHLEERMEDLLESGSSREEAIAAALEDFGDTAALAHHFTHIAHHHRRRRLMRYTYGTIAAMSCSILVLANFWPQNDRHFMPSVIALAQSESSQSDQDAATHSVQGKARSVDQIEPVHPDGLKEMRKLFESKLQQPYGPIEYFDVPLVEVLNDFQVTTGLTIIVDPQLVEKQNGIDLEQSVNLQLASGWLTAKAVLNDFIIKTYMGQDYGYVVKDGYIWITSLERTAEVIVYNCRDLLLPTSPRNDGKGQAAGGYGEEDGSSGVAAPKDQALLEDQTQDPNAMAAAEQQLIQVISNTVARGSWNVAGNTVPAEMTLGSIDAINGLIVVNHTSEVHEQVVDLLERLRKAKEELGLGQTIYSYPRLNRPGGVGTGFF